MFCGAGAAVGLAAGDFGASVLTVLGRAVFALVKSPTGSASCVCGFGFTASPVPWRGAGSCSIVTGLRIGFECRGVPDFAIGPLVMINAAISNLYGQQLSRYNLDMKESLPHFWLNMLK